MVRGVPEAEYFNNQRWVLPHLETVARHDKDGQTAAEYEQEILNRCLQLWELGEHDGIALTRVTRDAVRLEWVAGVNRTKWQHQLDEEIRKWGRALGKNRLIIHARPGWAKLASELGYREFQRVYEAKL